MEKIQSDINLLTPQFKEKVKLFLDSAKFQGHNIKVFEALRSKKRQEELYAIWRTTELTRKPVTWTLTSEHLTGSAADVVFVDAKWNPSWNWPYEKLYAIAKKYWIDNLSPTEQCHFQDDHKPLMITQEKQLIDLAIDTNSKLWNNTSSTELKKKLEEMNNYLRTLKQ